MIPIIPLINKYIRRVGHEDMRFTPEQSLSEWGWQGSEDDQDLTDNCFLLLITLNVFFLIFPNDLEIEVAMRKKKKRELCLSIFIHKKDIIKDI